jgi:hypothetical protein
MSMAHQEDERWEFTQEPVRGHLFVGAITDEMIERAGRALCDLENERDRQRYEQGHEKKHIPLAYEDWRDEYDAQARAAVVAALDPPALPRKDNSDG